MPFHKGQSGNPAGRPRGAVNHATAQVRDFFRELISDSTYRRALRRRITTGKAAPAIELYGWQLLGGKPTEYVEHSGDMTVATRVIHRHLKSSNASSR